MSLERVQARILGACERSGRDPGDVQLIAVTKGHDTDAIMALYERGHRDFGENRAQELRDKTDVLPGDIRWHFIGPLQTNKVRIVRPAVVALHSMDRASLATAWLKGPGDPPPVYLQVNVGEEDQKSGVSPGETGAFCDRLVELGHRVIGLMAIPPLADDPEDVRPYFRMMRELRDEVTVGHPTITGLSIGMTDDFEVAIEEGATAIRVGRAIFAD